MATSVAIFWLVVAFLAFIGAMAAVFAVCVRERRRVAPLTSYAADSQNLEFSDARRSAKIGHLQPIGGMTNGASSDSEARAKNDARSDNQVALVIFGGIILGALLAILVGYVVFFSGLA